MHACDPILPKTIDNGYLHILKKSSVHSLKPLLLLFRYHIFHLKFTMLVDRVLGVTLTKMAHYSKNTLDMIIFPVHYILSVS